MIFTRQFSSTSTASTAARTTRSPSPATTTASSSASTSRASSRASSVVRQTNPIPQSKPYQLNRPQMHATLHSEFIQSVSPETNESCCFTHCYMNKAVQLYAYFFLLRWKIVSIIDWQCHSMKIAWFSQLFPFFMQLSHS